MTEDLLPMTDSAHWHLATSIPVAAPGDTVEEILASMRGRLFDCADPVVVIDSQRHVLGQIPLSQLLQVAPGRTAEQVMQRDPPSVDLGTDQERVASVALHHDQTAVTVVDEDNRLAGVVPAQALLGILRREHVEDLHRLAGIVREEVHIREAMEDPPVRRARHRLPWLLLGLAGSILAAFVMKQFEGILSANIAVAFFVPGIVYLADAIGTQTETITVRGLSISHAPIGRMLAGEVRTGLLMGSRAGRSRFRRRMADAGPTAPGAGHRIIPVRGQRRCHDYRSCIAVAAGPARPRPRIRQRTAGNDRPGPVDRGSLFPDRLGAPGLTPAVIYSAVSMAVTASSSVGAASSDPSSSDASASTGPSCTGAA